MIYLSRLIKSDVFDSSDKRVGVLADIVVKPNNNHYPAVDFLLIRAAGQKKLFVPFAQAANLGEGIIVLNAAIDKIVPAVPEKSGLFLIRDVLDKQIIDINGSRVVRVNDIKLAPVENQMSLVGLDISWRGILRRLGLARLDVFHLFKTKLIDWRDAQMVRGNLRLNTVAQKLKRLHPADLANIVEELNVREGTRLLGSLEAASSAKILGELNPYLQKVMVRLLHQEQAVEILEKMSTDELSDLLQAMPNYEAKEILAKLEGEKHKKIEALLQYREDSAGGLMTNEFMAADPDWTVEQAIGEIRKVSMKFRSIMFIYVVDKSGKFMGPISARGLLVADGAAKLKEVVKPFKNFATLRPRDGVKKVISVMTKYNLFAAAVLDKEGRLLGVVTLDDVMRYLAPKA